MRDYEKALDKEARAERKRWNGKVIETSRQWLYNDYGSKAVRSYTMEGIMDAYADYKASEADWN